MEKYEVKLLPAAYSDLDEIFDFILTDNPPAADEPPNVHGERSREARFTLRFVTP